MALKPILINKINILKIKIILQNLYQMQISKYLIIYVLFNLIFIPKVISQQIKTYKGIYKNGNAEYQYYENKDYERILNGSYKFSRNVKEYGGYQVFSEKGFFKDGKKNGEWVFTIESFYGSIKKNVLTIKGNFVNNSKSGFWEQISKDYGSLNLSFSNDTIVGKIKRIEKHSNNTSTTIEANFDSKGKWDGEFKLLENDLEAIAIFKNNILVKNIMKRPSTGEILSRYSPDFDLTNFEESIKNYKVVPFIYYGQTDYRNNKENLSHLAGVSSLSDKQMDYLLQVENSFNYFMEYIFRLYWPHRKIGCEVYLPEFKGLNEILIINNPDILIIK